MAGSWEQAGQFRVKGAALRPSDRLAVVTGEWRIPWGVGVGEEEEIL